MVVVVAAPSGSGPLAGAAHVSAFDDVAEALEGAVVLAPAVLDQGVAEAHVVVGSEGFWPSRFNFCRFLAIAMKTRNSYLSNFKKSAACWNNPRLRAR